MKRRRTEELITFTEIDAQGVQFPHNDVVVIFLNIVDYDLCHILVDNGSSTNVLFYDTFSKMFLLNNHLGPVNSPLVGFIGDAMPVEGIITLTMTVGQRPKLVKT